VLQVGAALLAFSPSLALLAFLVSRRAQLLIIAISAGVVWLCAILVVAVLWSVLGLGTKYFWVVLIGSLSQEVGRMLLVRAYRRVERVVSKAIDAQPSTSETAHFALHDASASIGTFALMFMLLDVVLMVLAFLAQKQQDAKLQAIIFTSHTAASLLTLLGNQQGGCLLALPGVAAVLASLLYFARSYFARRGLEWAC